MDYKYIEQLLERYWNCETSVEEEEVLRAFFRQKEIPAHLLRYKSLFIYQQREKEIGLGSEFEARILAQIERPVVKARRLTLRARLMPLCKAAAVMALLFMLGGVVKESVDGEGKGIVYVYDQFENRKTDPQVAYKTDTVPVPLKVSDKTCSMEEP